MGGRLKRALDETEEENPAKRTRDQDWAPASIAAMYNFPVATPVAYPAVIRSDDSIMDVDSSHHEIRHGSHCF